jgi:hypothetical protein
MTERFKFQMIRTDLGADMSQSVTVKTDAADVSNVITTFRDFLVACGFSKVTVRDCMRACDLE